MSGLERPRESWARLVGRQEGCARCGSKRGAAEDWGQHRGLINQGVRAVRLRRRTEMTCREPIIRRTARGKILGAVTGPRSDGDNHLIGDR